MRAAHHGDQPARRRRARMDRRDLLRRLERLAGGKTQAFGERSDPAAIQEAARRQEHKAVSDIVRDSLRRHVAVQQFRSLRRKILPFAEAHGLVTDEDVFRALS